MKHTGTPNVGRNVVELLTVLVGNDRTTGCSGIYSESLANAGHVVDNTRTSSNHDSAVEDAPHNGRSGGGSFRQRHSLGVERRIARVVGEIEAGHY